MTSTTYSISSLNEDACRDSHDAFENSIYEFYKSASAAGLFSTSILSTGMYTGTRTDYSYVIYTSRDGGDEHPYVSTKIPILQIISYPVTDITVFSPTYPGSSPTCEISTNCSGCTISAPKVQLIYWPVHTISGYSNLTVASNATEPVTAIVNGTTFTSPTVYLSYDGAVAVDDCSRTIGKSYSGAILSLNPNDVSSISSVHGAQARVDFADLNKPYPLRVLFSICWPTPLESCILDPSEEYNPSLAVPAEIRALDPAWKTCVPDFFGSYDPPRVLVPAHALVSPTAAIQAEATSSTAIPVPTRTAPGVVSTSKPPTKDPPTKNPPTSDEPAKDPYASDQSTIGPFVNNPPAKNPSTKLPPMNDPPAKDPPVTNQPAKDPSASDLPAQDPPVKDPPANDPPVKDPTAKDPPAKESPVKESSASDPPAEDAPAKVSPEASFPVEASFSNDFSVISRSQTLTANSVNRPVLKTQTLMTDENDVSVSLTTASLQTFPSNDRFAFLEISISPLPSPFAPFVESDTKILYPTFTLPHLTFSSQTYVADSASRYIIASQTLTPNGQITVSGTPISLLPSASALVIGGTTEMLPHTFALPPLTIGAKTFTANSMSEYIVYDQTLTKGGQITVAGTPISLAIGTSTPPVGGSAHRLLPTITPTPLMISPETYALKPASKYIINDQTLTPGGIITVQGTPISLAPESSILVIGSGTENSQAASSALGLGRLILEGLGGGNGDDGDSEHNRSDGTTGHGNTATNNASARETDCSETISRGSSANFTGTPFIGSAERRKDQVWLGAAVVLSTLLLCT